MIVGTVYRVTTGEIEWYVQAAEEDVLQQTMGDDDYQVYIGKVDGNLYYIDHQTQTPIPKPEFGMAQPDSILADMIAEATITDIPVNTQVTWPDGVITIETDGHVEFSTDTEGSYLFRFELWPYQTKEITIEAVAAV